jgi:hypothetical protein
MLHMLQLVWHSPRTRATTHKPLPSHAHAQVRQWVWWLGTGIELSHTNKRSRHACMVYASTCPGACPCTTHGVHRVWASVLVCMAFWGKSERCLSRLVSHSRGLCVGHMEPAGLACAALVVWPFLVDHAVVCGVCSTGRLQVQLHMAWRACLLFAPCLSACAAIAGQLSWHQATFGTVGMACNKLYSTRHMWCDVVL